MALIDSAGIAIVIAPAITMFFFSWVGFKLVEGGNKTHESIGLFLVLMSFVQAINISNIINEYAISASLSPDIGTGLGYSYLISVIVFMGVMLYFILRIMVMPMIIANKKKKFKIE